MRRKHIFITIIFFWSAAVFPAALFAAEEPVKSPGSGGRVAVFPYFAADGNASEAEYAIYMVPDMIKIKLTETSRFIILGAAELENAAAELSFEGEYYRNESACLAAARKAGADYYIHGYLYTAGEQMSVVHTVVSSAEGKTLHIEKQALPQDRDLVAMLEQSAAMFAEWVGSRLPDPEPEVVVIERETLVEINTEPERVSFTMSTGAAYRIYLFESAQYLSPNTGADLGFLFSLPEWKHASVGFRLAFDLLNQKQSFYETTNQDITVLHMPVLLSGRLSFPVLHFLTIDGGLDLGGALLFGFVQPDVIANFRPSAAADAGLLFFPDSIVSVGIYAEAAASFFVHGDLLLFSAAPAVKINFNF